MSVWEDTAHYTVEGRGPFPFDMLRRAMSWPYSAHDADKLTQDRRRSIRLVAHQYQYITAERWESFGWKVSQIETSDEWVNQIHEEEDAEDAAANGQFGVGA